MGENKKEWMYDAFISYRHLEPDAFVAGSLHKILESYKLPGNLVKSNGDKLKRTKIKKVFRDAEELPLTSNLNDTIMTALENSEYLIAICSPRFGESLWCKKEVDTFIEMRGVDHVLTVLVDGEPSDSFPEALLYRNVEVTEPDGTVRIEREPMEPLAANARGGSNKERLKLLKTESLRLMAPMFGCSFDDLKQRHREQKMKRTMQIIGGVAAVCLAFGLISTSMALKISRQNSQIMEQNTQISAQAEKIEQQYQEALLSNALSTGDYADNLLKEGDRITAIEKAYSVLAHDGNELPYVPKVERILAKALNLYGDGQTLKADRILTCTSEINKIFLSPGGTRVVTRENDGTITVWNTENGQKLDSFVIGKDIWSSADDCIVFKDDSHFFYSDGMSLLLYDVDNKSKNVVAEDMEGSFILSYSPVKNRLLAVSYDGSYLFDSESFQLIAKADKDSEELRDVFAGFNFITCLDSSKLLPGRDDYFALSFTTLSSDELMIAVYDVNEGKLVATTRLDKNTVTAIKCYGDSMLLVTNETVDGTFKYDSSNMISSVYYWKINADKLEQKWKKSVSGTYVGDMAISLSGEGDIIACKSYDTCYLLNKDNGQMVKRIEASSEIVNLYAYSSSEIFSCVTREGKWLVVYSDQDQMLDVGTWESSNKNIKAFATAGCSVAVPYDSNTAIVYRDDISPDAEGVEYEHEKNFSNTTPDDEMREKLDKAGVSSSFVDSVYYDSDNRVMGVTYMNKTVEILSVDGNKNPVKSLAKYSAFEDSIQNIEISPDGRYVILNGYSSAYILRTEGNDIMASFPGEDRIVADIDHYVDVDFEKNCIYVGKYDDSYKIPIYETDIIAGIATETLEKSN